MREQAAAHDADLWMLQCPGACLGGGGGKPPPAAESKGQQNEYFKLTIVMFKLLR
jgi:iron only hydrogenase large subunit-like protein